MLNGVAAGTLKLRMEHTYPLADAAQAHRDLESRKTTGKLLLIPSTRYARLRFDGIKNDFDIHDRILYNLNLTHFLRLA